MRRALARWQTNPDLVVGGTTVALGVAIATAPLTRTVPVVLASMAWFVAVAAAVAVRLVPGRRHITAGVCVFTVGVGLAAVRMSALGVLQVLSGRPALFWNVDWRYHATQAHGIARFGTLRDSLDYAGRPVEYHVGPAWITGGWERVGVPADVVSFVVIPFVAVAVIGLGAYRLLRSLGATRDPALVAVGITVGLATGPLSLLVDVVRGDPGAFLDAERWWFTPSLMLNSLLALAVGIVAAWLVVRARAWPGAVAGAVALGTLVAIKPQYLAGLLAALGLGFVVRGGRDRPWRDVALAVGVTVVTAALVSAITPQATSFTGVTVDPFHGLRAGLTDYELLVIALPAIAVLLAVPVVRRTQPARLRSYALWSIVGVGMLFGFLYSVVFLLDAGQIANARAVGLNLTRAAYQFDVQQSLVAAALVVVLLGVTLATALALAASPGVRRGALVIAVLAITMTIPFTAASLATPTGRAGYEWTEDEDLRALYDAVDVTDGRWIASDLADSADDAARPLRATNLTALGDAQFWLSNADYSGWNQPDVVERVRAVQRFFRTPWSPAHDSFLRRAGIRFVLVHDRCPPAWAPADFPGRIVEARGTWTLLRVGPADPDPGERGWPAFERGPRSGRGACLSGRRSR